MDVFVDVVHALQFVSHYFLVYGIDSDLFEPRRKMSITRYLAALDFIERRRVIAVQVEKNHFLFTCRRVVGYAVAMCVNPIVEKHVG